MSDDVPWRQLDTVTQERDAAEMRSVAHLKMYTECRQQLATAQNELCTAQDQIPPDMEDDSLSTALIKLKDERTMLRAENTRLRELLSRDTTQERII